MILYVIRLLFFIGFFTGLILIWRVLNNVTDLKFEIGYIKSKIDTIEKLILREEKK